MIELVAEHNELRSARSAKHEMCQQLHAHGDGLMHSMYEDAVMVVHECEAAKRHFAMLRRDAQSIRDEAHAYMAMAATDGAIVVVRPSEEQVASLSVEPDDSRDAFGTRARCGPSSARSRAL